MAETDNKEKGSKPPQKIAKSSEPKKAPASSTAKAPAKKAVAKKAVVKKVVVKKVVVAKKKPVDSAAPTTASPTAKTAPAASPKPASANASKAAADPAAAKARTGVQELQITKKRVSRHGVNGKVGNLTSPQVKKPTRTTSKDRPSSGGYAGGRPHDKSSTGGGPRRTDSSAPSTPDNNQGKRIFRKKGNNKTSYRKEPVFNENEKGFIFKKTNNQPANPVPKEISIMDNISVADLAKKMNLRGSDLISKLIGMGMMVNINHVIDADTATILADDFGAKIKVISLYDETVIEYETNAKQDIRPRAPIVTVMGHVDHGKTSLLDAIRQGNIVDDEHGGITQHIAAYNVNTPKGSITFLDTPGHEAFTLMRARGAQLTDLIILVVAADDGVMPQTIEAINHAKDSKVPVIVAINKVDKPDSNIEHVKTQLSEYELVSESWGGKTQFIEVSALKKQGINELLDAILLESEVLELKADWLAPAQGRVVESQVEQGRGISATVIIQQGVLKIGAPFVAGIYSGKVRSMFDSTGAKIQESVPSMPVEITGFTSIPEAGDPFQTTKTDKDARSYSQKRQELKSHDVASSVRKVTLDNLYDSIEAGSLTELRVIIKGDVQGSVEAIKTMLEKLSTKEIRLLPIHAAAGAIVENDVQLAIASNAIIIGFNVRPTPRAQELIHSNRIDFRRYNVIYEIVEDITIAMEGLLSPEFEEVTLGEAEVRTIFKVSKLGEIAGCMVTSGKIIRKNGIHLVRAGEIIFTGKLDSLQREKDSVKEVREGFECGMVVDGYDESLQEGDIIRSFEMREIKKSL